MPQYMPGSTGIWNPNENFELDPATGQYRQRQPERPTDQMGGGYDLDAFYQQTFGRAPDANERSTDLANIAKYGAGAFEQDQQKRLSAPTQQGQQYATPTQQWNAQPQMSGQSDELFKLLMQRATQGTAVNRNDPNIRSQVDPATAQMERASRNYVDDVAERRGPLANIQGERRLAAERTGQAAGALESEVVGREIDSRRQEIAQALQLYGSRLGQQEQMALQRELATLDSMLRREGFGLQRDQMNLSNDQFLRELALRQFDLDNTWDYRWSQGV